MSFYSVTYPSPGSTQVTNPGAPNSSVTPSPNPPVTQTTTVAPSYQPLVRSDALRLMRNQGRRTPGSRSRRGIGETTFNEVGTSIPQALAPRLQNHRFRCFSTEVRTNWLASSTLLEVDQAFYYQITTLPNFASFSTIFDQYRIRQIELWLIPRRSIVSSSAGANPGLLCSAIDLDDAGAVSFSSLQEYESAIVSHSIDGHYRKFVPHCAITAYAGGFANFINEPSPWIDVNSSGVEHYGCKFAITRTSDVVDFDLRIRIDVEFKTVR